jgi:AhpC/TSA family
MRTTSILLMLLAATWASPGAPPTPRPAPELAWTVPGQGQQMLRQYLGKVVALEFIYTTCKHCFGPAQVLDKLQQELGGQGFQAIEIAFDPNASVLAEPFIADQHLKLPVGWTLGDQVSPFLGYGPTDRFVVPQIVLVDRAGVVRYQTRVQGHDDLRSEPVLRARITELLQPANAAPKSPESAKPRR